MVTWRYKTTNKIVLVLKALLMKGDRGYDESVNQVVLGIVEGTGIIQYEK